MLITAAEARAHIPGLTGTAEDATVIEPLIKRVGGIFARRCGYPGSAPSMESRSYTLDLASEDPRTLDLEVYPVASVTSAYTDHTGDFEGSELTVTVSDIGVRDGRAARLLSTSSSAWSAVANRVTFVAGHNGSTTASGAHNASITTITVVSTAGFHLDAGLIRVLVGTEIIYATSKTATTLTGCTRGAEGTTAASISDGATITQPAPDDLKQLVAEAVRYLFDLRQIQGKDSVSQGGNTTSFRDLTRATGERDHLPDNILAGLGAYILPRALV